MHSSQLLCLFYCDPLSILYRLLADCYDALISYLEMEERDISQNTTRVACLIQDWVNRLLLYIILNPSSSSSSFFLFSENIERSCFLWSLHECCTLTSTHGFPIIFSHENIAIQVHFIKICMNLIRAGKCILLSFT